MVWSRLSLVGMICFLFFLLWMIEACTLHSSKPSSSRPSPSRSFPSPDIEKSHSSAAEQQLLTTVKNAEQLGPGNPLLLSSLYSLAAYYGERKEYDKAAAQYEKALRLKEEANGPNHPDVAAILKRYAQLLLEANRSSEAESLLHRADAILTQSSVPILRP
jgi:tetratricopeptide (TPR) repeat protein